MGIWGSSGAEGMAGGQAEGRREEDSLIWRQTLKGRLARQGLVRCPFTLARPHVPTARSTLSRRWPRDHALGVTAESASSVDQSGSFRSPCRRLSWLRCGRRLASQGSQASASCSHWQPGAIASQYR